MSNIIINQHTYAAKNHRRYETNDLPSKTVPGQTLSLKTLLERFTRGQGVETYTPIYDDSGTYPDNLERMDKMEKLELARGIKSKIKEVQSRPKPQKPIPPVAENVTDGVTQ